MRIAKTAVSYIILALVILCAGTAGFYAAKTRDAIQRHYGMKDRLLTLQATGGRVMTREQIALLNSASQGNTLLTIAGSDNDMLWAELAERGLLESTAPPKEMTTVPDISFHAWRMTEPGKKTFAADFRR